MSLVRVDTIRTFIGSIKGKEKTATNAVLLSKGSSFLAVVATTALPAKNLRRAYGYRKV
jgi:hypothetical protein